MHVFGEYTHLYIGLPSQNKFIHETLGYHWPQSMFRTCFKAFIAICVSWGSLWILVTMHRLFNYWWVKTFLASPFADQALYKQCVTKSIGSNWWLALDENYNGDIDAIMTWATLCAHSQKPASFVFTDGCSWSWYSILITSGSLCQSDSAPNVETPHSIWPVYFDFASLKTYSFFQLSPQW